MPRYDVAVIGAGPGGYVAAIHCAQFGLHTALIERTHLGGVCLNCGCIPSKAMLHAAELLQAVEGGSTFGLQTQTCVCDYGALVARREAGVHRLRQGVAQLLHGNGVELLKGTARLISPHQALVASEAAEQTIEFQHLIIATGSRPALPPIPGTDLAGVIDSDAALQLEAPPERAVVIGGGAVGVEWAEIWRALGSQVMVLEMLPQLLPGQEPEIVRELARSWDRKGIEVRTGAAVRAIEPGPGGLEVVAVRAGGEERFGAQTVLVATGRRPNLEGLGLEAAGVRAERHGIPTDAFMRTNVPHIFAVGDVTGRAQLAHVASHQGIVAAETIAGGETEPFDAEVAPAVVFTDPEIASVGLTEAAARAQGLQVQVGRFPFAASGRGAASGQTTGLVKLVADARSAELLGAHILGPRAGELISEASLALRLHARLWDLARAIHPHPTFSEALMEAAWAALGRPIHIPPRRGRPGPPSANR